MMKKYELTDDKITHKGKLLNRIRCLETIRDKNRNNVLVKSGELGGYVESENNLSHDGTCWIYDEAKVYGKARLENDEELRRSCESIVLSVYKDDDGKYFTR